MRVRIVQAAHHHVRLIAANMRAADRAEVLAGWDTGHGSVKRCIYEALESSPRYARTAFVGLEVLAIYGLTAISILGDSACVWCFGTEAIDRHRLAFARASRAALADMHRQARVLTNYVAADDARAQRWLEYLGATYVLQPERRGGRLFGQFILARDDGGRECQQG